MFGHSPNLGTQELPSELWHVILKNMTPKEIIPLRTLNSLFWQAGLDEKYRRLDIALPLGLSKDLSSFGLPASFSRLEKQLRIFSEPFIAERVRCVRVQPGLCPSLSLFNRQKLYQKLLDNIQFAISTLSEVDEIIIGSIKDDDIQYRPSPYIGTLLTHCAPRLAFLTINLEDEPLRSSKLLSDELRTLEVSFPELKSFKFCNREQNSQWQPLLQRMLSRSLKLERLEVDGGGPLPLPPSQFYPSLTAVSYYGTPSVDIGTFLQTHHSQIRNLVLPYWFQVPIASLPQFSLLECLSLHLGTAANYQQLMATLKNSVNLRELSIRAGVVFTRPQVPGPWPPFPHIPSLERLYIFTFSYDLHSLSQFPAQLPRLKAFTLQSDHNLWCGSVKLDKYSFGCDALTKDKSSESLKDALLEMNPLPSEWRLETCLIYFGSSNTLANSLLEALQKFIPSLAENPRFNTDWDRTGHLKSQKLKDVWEA